MKIIKGLIFICGAVLVFGGIGAEQTSAITFGQAVTQCLVGLPMFAIGVM